MQAPEFTKKRPGDESEIRMTAIAQNIRQTENESLLVFKVKTDHDPGQFMQVSVLGYGECPISICSYEKDKIELSIRRAGNVTNRLCEMKKGEKIGLRGPYGHGHDMKKYRGKDITIIGGGSGVAPQRSVIEYISKHRKDFKEINVFLGFKKTADILFKEDHNTWQKNNINLDMTISENNPKNIKHYFLKKVLESKATDPKPERIIIICGSSPLINSTCCNLINKGITPNQIFVSEERHMKCGIGKCGHCMIRGNYCCTDGPVFRLDRLRPENR